tara:strand:+ start:109 stop:264 length:156 start_codon:yes stop_codon:yes gene_type:complete
MKIAVAALIATVVADTTPNLIATDPVKVWKWSVCLSPKDCLDGWACCTATK